MPDYVAQYEYVPVWPKNKHSLYNSLHATKESYCEVVGKPVRISASPFSSQYNIYVSRNYIIVIVFKYR